MSLEVTVYTEAASRTTLTTIIEQSAAAEDNFVGSLDNVRNIAIQEAIASSVIP